jgi:hypothetical protein
VFYNVHNNVEISDLNSHERFFGIIKKGKDAVKGRD